MLEVINRKIFDLRQSRSSYLTFRFSALDPRLAKRAVAWHNSTRYAIVVRSLDALGSRRAKQLIRRKRKHNPRKVRLYCDELVITFDSNEIARHPRDWSGRGEHYCVEHYLELLKKAPALLDHGKPFVRMPAWLSRLREALDDDKELVTLLLAVDGGKFSIGELEDAAAEAIARRCVTRAIVESRALSARLECSESPEELESDACGSLAEYDFDVGSADHFDELAQRA